MDDILRFKLPLTGPPDEVLPDLREIITSFIDKEKTDHFFIGKSEDLTNAKAKLECDAMVSIYQDRNASDVRHLEFLLLKEYYRNSKNYNKKADSGEEIFHDSMNYLYLALWFK